LITQNDYGGTVMF